MRQAERWEDKRGAPQRRPRKTRGSRQAVRRAALEATRAVAPGLPVIPPGLPLLWVPTLVVARLSEMNRLVIVNPGPGVLARVRTRDAPVPAVRAWAEDAGVAWRKLEWLLFGRPGFRPVVVCPSCRRDVVRLVALEGRWHCWGCAPEGALGPRLAGDYAFGLRIGCRGRRMTLRRRSLMRLAARLAARARRPADLVAVAQLAALVRAPAKAPRALWSRLTRRVAPSTLTPGPFRRWATPYVIPAAIDSLLHYAAFLERFGGET